MSMLDSVPGFIVEAPVEPLVKDKQMLWPSLWGLDDASRFPELQAIKARHGASRLQPLSSFVQAIAEARMRVWLLDDYLFKASGEMEVDKLEQLLEWFPIGLAAGDIRLLTKSAGTHVDAEYKEAFDKRTREINSFRRNERCKIDVRFSLQTNFPYVHDRFAIVDDELWHFGAAVGGLHRQVNATTRGWSAAEHGAAEFFCLAWDHDEKVGKRR
ncbi:hypothetical protein N5D48_21245 [Pseudomonas sp. GD03858]|uniref:hypothetical protein n=1 Tax=unclassified Pseudomonas TaxID=196821 RepID=UPI002446E2BD|nr:MULTISPECIES: hypothetical protein [unclassified Pseudomonas]MDH0648740.1 hypothetical protein [Pseudomonas sp. GD03867]MDH0664936.1 hypothetical protein [Pseudomonas sp. GD03858]